MLTDLLAQTLAPIFKDGTHISIQLVVLALQEGGITQHDELRLSQRGRGMFELDRNAAPNAGSRPEQDKAFAVFLANHIREHYLLRGKNVQTMSRKVTMEAIRELLMDDLMRQAPVCVMIVRGWLTRVVGKRDRGSHINFLPPILRYDQYVRQKFVEVYANAF